MYSISLSQKSVKYLKKLPKKEASIILNKIYSIRNNPFRYVKKLEGDKFWRLRIGDNRAILDIIISGQKIIVIRIGKRKNVYD